jgi:hypothetical protein
MATAGFIQPLETIFQGSTRFIVPDFQRNYAWEQEDIEALLEDIVLGAEKASQHFIGSLIVRIDETNPEIAYVIDGQQRLTTLFMTVACLRDYVAYSGNEELKIEGANPINVMSELNNFLFTMDDQTYAMRDRFEAHPMIAEMFSKQVLAHPLPNRPQLPVRHHKFSQRLRDAHKLLRQWPAQRIEEINQARAETDQFPMTADEELAWIRRVLRVIKGRITLLQISTQDEVESFDIFMSLNSTGRNLGPADLVKSHIFNKLTIDLDKPAKDKRNRELTEQWQEVLQNVGKGDIDQFLRHYLLSRQNEETVRGRDIFRIFKTMLDPRENEGEGLNEAQLAQKHLSLILSASQIYEEILEFTALNSFIGRRALETLNEIGTSYRVFLLTLFDPANKFDLQIQEQLTLKIEAFNLRWVLTGGNAQMLENFYQLLSEKLLKGSSAQEISLLIEAKMPSDEEVQTKFQSEASSSKQTKLILYRIEQELTGTESDFASTSLHLEQIAPPPQVNGYQDWLNHLFPGETEQMDLEYETTVSQWGNYTLVEKPLPAPSRAAKFTIKVDGDEDYLGYKNSNFQITRGLAKFSDWTRFSIKARNKWIADSVCAIWPASGPEKLPMEFEPSYLDIQQK